MQNLTKKKYTAIYKKIGWHDSDGSPRDGYVEPNMIKHIECYEKDLRLIIQSDEHKRLLHLFEGHIIDIHNDVYKEENNEKYEETETLPEVGSTVYYHAFTFVELILRQRARFKELEGTDKDVLDFIIKIKTRGTYTPYEDLYDIDLGIVFIGVRCSHRGFFCHKNGFYSFGEEAVVSSNIQQKNFFGDAFKGIKSYFNWDNVEDCDKLKFEKCFGWKSN